MKIEVILQGRGSVTVEQDADWELSDIEAFTAGTVHLIRNTAGKEPYGFAAGNGGHLEHGDGDPDPHEVGRVIR